MDFTFHPGVNGSSPWVEFYPYNPSLPAGYAFMAIFAIATLIHFFLMIPYRAAYFIPFVLGGICTVIPFAPPPSNPKQSIPVGPGTRMARCLQVLAGETFGYHGRARSHNNRTGIGPWAQQQMLLLCAPPLLSASIYMTLSRLMTSLNAEEHSPIRPKALTVLFVLNDIICLLTQLVGAGLQVTGDEKIISIGNKAVLAGLIFTLFVFGWFIWVVAMFHRRLGVHPTVIALDEGVSNWRVYMGVLYGVCGCMVVRNLVRTIEFGSPHGADVRSREVYIYLFDGALMACVMVLWLVWHPGRLIKAARRVRKGVEGSVELLEGK
ncbi:putative RTA1 domain protein [Aspergillus spinulosporus]